MNITKLYLRLHTEAKTAVCNTILEAGIKDSLGGSSRAYYTYHMVRSHGDTRELYKRLSRLDPKRLDRFYTAITTYEDSNNG